jgi:hypothetical protein
MKLELKKLCCGEEVIVSGIRAKGSDGTVRKLDALSLKVI